MDPSFSYLRLIESLQSRQNQFERSSQVDWLCQNTQELCLEQKCAQMAVDYISMSEGDKDASHCALELALSHAELNFWRAFQDARSQAVPELQTILEKISTVVSIAPDTNDLRIC